MNENYYYKKTPPKAYSYPNFLKSIIQIPKHILKGLNSAFRLTIRLGMKMVLGFTLVPKLSWNDLQNLDVNCAPESDIMDNGIAWGHTTSPMKSYNNLPPNK